ncbi:MAG: BrnA antitoxin family protein [Ferrovum sp.]|nr:BrnA antitoxin family protein [Ferrovum sp.]
MPRFKLGTIAPTQEENVAITAAAMSDPDAMPFTDAEWAAVKPQIRIGRPKAEVTKERITIRLSRDVVTQFRASGEGWQTRIDEALCEQSLAVTACLDQQKDVYIRFLVSEQSEAMTFDAALEGILSSLRMLGAMPIPIYPVISSRLTVKGRISIGNNLSIWVFRAARRIQPASPQEIAVDRKEIDSVLESHGIHCNWVN